jgi:glycosyltransferase involved in cell wall biosynthesis
MKEMPRVSAINCTRDRADDLARCLPTVLANDFPDFEVIVVDQSSTDATQRVVEAPANPRLRYYRQHVRPTTAARRLCPPSVRSAIAASRDGLRASRPRPRRAPIWSCGGLCSSAWGPEADSAAATGRSARGVR